MLVFSKFGLLQRAPVAGPKYAAGPPNSTEDQPVKAAKPVCTVAYAGDIQREIRVHTYNRTQEGDFTG